MLPIRTELHICSAAYARLNLRPSETDSLGPGNERLRKKGPVQLVMVKHERLPSTQSRAGPVVLHTINYPESFTSHPTNVVRIFI